MLLRLHTSKVILGNDLFSLFQDNFSIHICEENINMYFLCKYRYLASSVWFYLFCKVVWILKTEVCSLLHHFVSLALRFCALLAIHLIGAENFRYFSEHWFLILQQIYVIPWTLLMDNDCIHSNTI